MAASKLSEAGKKFVTVRKACGEADAVIRSALKERYGIELTRQAIHLYDPDRNPSMPKKLVDLFRSTQKAFVEQLRAAPIADKNVRVARLEEEYQLLKTVQAAELERPHPNRKLIAHLAERAAAINEQAAREMGGSYTSKHELDLTSKGERVSNVVVYLPDNGRSAHADRPSAGAPD